ncbi:serine hydrolase domain-containing protein [Paenibacillus puerhi]|uniref:serine hydrolase domain-containing protein n=1 Tax=Paenibacillus puerhi TaxID=2692622 RepID=UPI00135C0C5B|nr:serine hydrolase [Paenibacillus puerhi]
MKTEQAQASIEAHFRRLVQKNANLHNAYLLVQSDKLGIRLELAEGTTGGMPAHARQPYCMASVSKLFTSVLIGMLFEQGLLSYEDPISKYLDSGLLDRLHVHKGTDYTHDIRIKHLLNHKSGLPCFLEDKPKQGKSILDLLLGEPSRLWTPQAMIEWSKAHLKAHFPPGQGFHYTDTGYHLLGLIIENVTARPFHEALHHYLFEPLGMKHSSFFRKEPIERSEYPLAHLYVRNTNITDYNSLSLLYAGGGLVSTSQDMHVFMKALVHHRLLAASTIELMKKDCGRFFPGIDYGYGVMMFKHVPLIMPAKYQVWGNAGSTGSFMFYHPALDTYIIGSLNHFRYHQKGIRLMLHVIGQLHKCAG